MRRAGPFLIMLLLLIAYGRCVADQFGMLHTTEASCCQVICQDEHCSDVKADSPDEHGTNGTEDEQPAPCQLCLIISTDGATFDSGIKVPSPQVLDLASAAVSDMLFKDILGLCTAGESLLLPVFLDNNPPDVPVSQWIETATRILPVRGPSLV